MIDGFATDMAIGMANRNAHEWANNAESWKAEAVRVSTMYNELADVNAANLGMRYALMTQLAQIDPENPLLKDKSLVERIFKAAETAFKINNQDFNASREAGRTFKVPGREPGWNKPRVAPPELLKNQSVAYLQEAYAGSLAQRYALATQLKRADMLNPLLKDAALFERVRSSGVVAYRMNGDDYESAREAGRTFVVPGRTWNPGDPTPYG